MVDRGQGCAVSLVRKGSRLITVDGARYRWRVRHRPSYGQGLAETPLTFAVELADPPGAVLVVRTRHAHPGNWMALPAKPVLPADVAAAIRTALAGGWTPTSPGPAFSLRVGNEAAPNRGRLTAE